VSAPNGSLPEAKRCKGCSETKPASEYYIVRTKRGDRLRPRCKVCHTHQTLEWYEKNREKMLAWTREYERVNRSKKLQRNAEWRKNNVELMREHTRRWRAADPKRRLAHSLVQYELAAGRMVRQPCEVCGATELIDAHHDDYNRPLDVRWLCKKHHRQHHEKLNPRPRRLQNADVSR